MSRWHEVIRQDHEELRALTEDVDAVLATPDVVPEQRQEALAWIARAFAQKLQPHLAREDHLWGVLVGLVGDRPTATMLLKAQQQALRTAARQVVALLQGLAPVDWAAIRREGALLIELMHDHEKTVDRLVIDVLEFSVTAAERAALAQAFAEGGTLPRGPLEALVEEALARHLGPDPEAAFCTGRPDGRG